MAEIYQNHLVQMAVGKCRLQFRASSQDELVQSFRNDLQEFLDSDCPYQKKDATLNDLHCIFAESAAKKSRFLKLPFSRAESLIESASNLLLLSLTHPEVLTILPNTFVSGVRLAPSTTKAQVVEIATALQASELFQDHSGRPASFTAITHLAEQIFNIDLSAAQKIRNQLYTRKTQLSPTLDLLRTSFLDRNK